MRTPWTPVAALVTVCMASSAALAQEQKAEPLAKGIQDNSFLIEEAYNQEPGVVQSYSTFRRQGGNRYFAFTQEFPVGGQDHQLSYILPYSFLRSQGVRSRGIGDVLLNYRYQALYESATVPAFAPRISLILPTGSASTGAGNGSLGFQGSLPFSKIVADRVTLHANFGFTAYTNVQGRSPKNYNVGGSVVYAATKDFNLLVEAIGERNESVDADRRIERQSVLTISPGVRYAINLNDYQVVFGVGAPIVMQHGMRPNYGALVYFSMEGKVFR